jgi:hypothetical protein
MSVVIVKYENPENWDEQIARLNGSLFLYSAWLMSIKAPGRTPVFFKFFHEKKIVALLSGLERPIQGTNHKQLFFYSGIAWNAEDEKYISSCKVGLYDFAKNNGYARINMKSYDLTNSLNQKLKGFSRFVREEYLISLEKSESELSKGFIKNTRRLIHKAEKEGAVFGMSYSVELLKELFFLSGETKTARISKGYSNYNAMSLPFLDQDSLGALLIQKKACIFYIKFKNEIISIQFTLTFFPRTYGVILGTNEIGYSMAAASLLHYKSLLYLKGAGFTTYNIGGIPLGSENTGIKKFKRSIGANPVVSWEEYTDFLVPELKSLNPFLKTKRLLYNIRMPWKMKKKLLGFIHAIIKGKDEY